MDKSTYQINDITDLDEVARRLRALSRRYQDFFQLQFQRLESHMRTQQQMVDRADSVRGMLDEIQSQKDSWETKRSEEMQQIDEAGKKLVLTWQTLEERQRQALAGKSPLPHSEPLPASPSSRPEMDTVALSSFSDPKYQAEFAAAAAEIQNQSSNVSVPQQPNSSPASHPASPAPTKPTANPENSIDDSGDTPVDSETAIFEYEQLKRQMREHAKRQV